MGHWLEWPRALKLALSLALLLGIPGLFIGFYSDDWSHLGFLRGQWPEGPGVFDLYNFVPHDPARTARQIQEGMLPWWTSPDLQVRFLRPLSSAAFVLDYKLFGDNPLGYHVHALLWGVALVGGAAAVFRRVLPPSIAGLALLLFAVDDVHSQPAAWIAGRQALIAAAPALFGLAAYTAHRLDRFRHGVWLAPLLFAVGLAGAETAIGVLAYVAAFELWGPLAAKTPWSSRMRHLLPVGLVFVAYLVVYKLLGCGAAHNGAYVDPLGDPMAFGEAALTRLPLLIGAYFLAAPSELAAAFPLTPLLAQGALAMAMIALIYRAIRDHVTPEEKGALRWLVPGALLALLTALGGFPGNRLLIAPSVGGAALLAVLLRHGFLKLASTGIGLALRRGAVGLLVVVHFVLAPLGWLSGALFLRHVAAETKRLGLDMDLSAPTPPEVFVLSASDPMAALYAPMARAILAPHDAAHYFVVSLAKGQHVITRLGPSSLRVELRDGTLTQTAFETVFRAPSEGFHEGQTIAMGEGLVRVAKVEEGAPKAVDVELRRNLDDPSIVLLVYREGAFVRLKPGDLSAPLVVPWSPGPTGFF